MSAPEPRLVIYHLTGRWEDPPGGWELDPIKDARGEMIGGRWKFEPFIPPLEKSTGTRGIPTVERKT